MKFFSDFNIFGTWLVDFIKFNPAMSSALAKRIKHRRYMNETDEVQDELIIMGYACNLFRDDEKVEYINEERHLIVHPVDDSVTTDRFDGRLCINDLRDYDSDITGPSDDATLKEDDVDQAELELERYRDLIAADDDFEEDNNPTSESQTGEHIGGASPQANGSHPSSPAQDERKEKRKEKQFTPPEELQLPDGIQQTIGDLSINSEPLLDEESIGYIFVPLSSTMRILLATKQKKKIAWPETTQMHAIIAKTAAFVVARGAQMEIVIKAKQKGNDHRFGFLEFDHNLRPYYDHVLSMIKQGRYKFVEEQESDEDSDDGDYLHPSLMISAGTSFKAKEKQPDSNMAQGSQQLSSAEMLPIIDRLAEYVARNGDEFEDVVRSRCDPLYGFIESDHQYNACYRQHVVYYRSLYQQLAEAKSLQSNDLAEQRSASSSPSPSCSNDKSDKPAARRAPSPNKEAERKESPKTERRSRRESPPSKRSSRRGSPSSKKSKQKRRRRGSSDDDGKEMSKRKARRERKAQSDEEKGSEENERRSVAVKCATFVPVPASESSEKEEEASGQKEKSVDQDVASPMSDNVKCSLGLDGDAKGNPDNSVKKMQEERRAKVKIFLRLMHDRDQQGSKVVNSGCKPWEDD